ncbi:proline--tRNA ligase, partial [Chamaesiphon sp. VAR_48_metabat_403]|uniref:proline--tRNA ligase n=1 Tax=Chamaesiphon sp. VAR_48_metabat_403 TaxID=2964700 RepID=UPI00286E640C
IMKDGYSFHTDTESLKATYDDMHDAYCKMLTRCGLKFRAVDADSGAIGGSGSQEFMVLADAGEDDVMYTADGKYAANVEKAVSLAPDAVASTFTSYEIKDTPNTNSIKKLAKFFECDLTSIVKNVLQQAVYDNGKTVLILISIRSDREVNQVKLTNELGKLAPNYGAKTVIALEVPDGVAIAKWAAKPLPLGYIAPDLSDEYIQASPNIHPQFLRIVDRTAASLTNFITGTNEAEKHVVGANWNINFPLPSVNVDVQKAMVGDRAIHDPTQLMETARGIEVGHIFQLGTKYSAAMGATFTNEQGEEQPLVMGCYGVGVSRLAQAAVEQSYDKDGIIWPIAIAPYHAIICVPNISDAQQMEVAERLYTELNQMGVETILDDRDERAGVKFKDADLIGIPFRIVTGRSLKDGKVEVVQRATKQSQDIAVGDVGETIKQWIGG